VRRTVALLFAAALLGAAAAGSRAVDQSRDRAVRREGARAAETARTRAADALSAQVAELKGEARNAASNPRLVAALRGNVDAPTLQDLFRTEEWWQPYRSAFKVYAVAFDSERLDVIEGMTDADFASDALIRKARAQHQAVAEIVMGKGWPYAATAVALDVPERPAPVVLVLAKPVDGETVRALADKAGGAILLSDGKRVVIEAGSEPERARLRGAVGAEAAGSLYQPPVAPGAGERDDGWAAAVTPLGPGLWMWVFGSGASEAAEAASTATSTRGALWAIAALLALGALVVGFRRGQPAVAPSLVEAASSASLPAPASTSEGLGPGAAAPPDPALPRTRPGAGSSPAPGAPVAELVNAATEIHQSGAAFAGARGKSVTFGRYTLLDLLGAGGMAEVYTAVTFGAEGFRRTFVVKRLRAELSRDPSVVAQFIDEANLGSSLVHSNIIPVFDFGKVDAEYFLAQEYILGRDLGRVTARALEREGKPLPVPVILFAAHETLKALEYAHTKTGDGGRALGIVHRDVSPSNVLLSARGEVKLFDFGIVKAQGRVTKTEQGVVKGNVSFMSPEQARGIEIDARADLFSLGLVIFYCLTGDVLYHGNTTYELLVKAATGPGPDELARIAALPGPCGDILLKALAIDPALRYATAGEFAGAIAPHLGGGPAEAVRLMRALFEVDFQQEEARFAAALPSTDRNARPDAPGTQELVSRRS
jgi:Protein kinase domain